MIGGVAAGIGKRYGIDPVIVRVALVVSAIYGGAGLLFYLLGWLLLPEEGDEVSAVEGLVHRGRSSMSAVFTLLLCVALIPASNFVFGGHISTVAGGIILLGALYLLHRSRSGYHGVQDAVPTPAQPTVPIRTDAEVGSMNTQSNDVDGPGEANGPQDAMPTERLGPPAWDPLGAAPFAWDLPDPHPVQAQPTQALPVRHRSRAGLAILGSLLVAGAVLAMAAPYTDWLSTQHIFGLLLAILGLGLVAASFVHGGRGLIWLAILASIVGMLLSVTRIDRWQGGGDAHYVPTSLVGVRPSYDLSFGNLRLDLTQLPGAGSVHTRINLGAGDVTVIVPPSAEVHATCHANVGDVRCLENSASGPGVTEQATQSGTGGPDITLDVTSGAGNVEVFRG